MLNPFKEINWNPDRAERRKFAISLIIGFPCLAIILFAVRGVVSGNWSFVLPLTIGCAGAGTGMLLWALPVIARPFYVAWYFVACCIGIVVGNLLLGLVFYIFVTGLGLLRRVGGRGPIRKFPDKGAQTYWRDAVATADLQRYYRQF